jgi:hypothetical protein
MVAAVHRRHSGARVGANPESSGMFGVCNWIPGSLAYASAPE